MDLRKVISGGQTGVDRAALDAAMACGIAVGGWCPRGRRAEDGPIPGRYPLTETPSLDYPVRTNWNVRDADATLIVTLGALDGGTQLTAKLAASLGKPHRIVHAQRPGEFESVLAFLRETPGSTLNVAGPRESRAPGIEALARDFLLRLFRAVDDGEGEPATVVPKRPPGEGGAEAPS